MIRKFEINDLNEVMQIWLNENIESHKFIPSKYWTDNYKNVKSLIPKAEIYVHENAHTKQIDGFIGLNGNYIEGLFVEHSKQSKGIGKELLSFAKKSRSELSLKVYGKNSRAISFYEREGFCIQYESVDDTTGEKELIMIWNNGK